MDLVPAAIKKKKQNTTQTKQTKYKKTPPLNPQTFM